MPRRFWTEKEKDILEKNWLDFPRNEIANLLPNKSLGGISKMALRMGLPSKRRFRRRLWTEREEKILRENWKDLPKEKLMRILPNRSWYMIAAKAHQMHLPFRYNHPPKKPRPFRPLTDFGKGYLCAAIDGEGSLVFHMTEKRIDIISRISRFATPT